MQKLTTLLPAKNLHKALDIGTGSGDFIELLHNFFPKIHFTGIDPDGIAISTARERFSSEGFDFVTMHAHQLGFSDHTFDLCTLSNALHHLESPSAAIAEMKRVTRPSGWIIISELRSDALNEAQENHKIYHHHRSAIDRLNGIYHRETYTSGEILELAKKEGLEPEFQFEFLRQPTAETAPEQIARFVKTMQNNLSRIAGSPHYEALAKMVLEFEQRANVFGIQAATNLVLGFKVAQRN